IVSTLITYSCMGLLVALGPWEDSWDRWVKADRKTLEDVVQRLHAMQAGNADHNANPPSPLHAIWLIGIGMAFGYLCLRLGALLPATSSLSASGWAFLLITIFGILLSLTPAKYLEDYGAS